MPNPSGKITGVILAGGMSRRMGGVEKSLIELGGKPLITQVVNSLSQQVPAIVINANGDPSRFDLLGLPVVADPQSDSIEAFAGPLSGVLAGMEWAQTHTPNSEFIATVAADTPFFPDDFVARLAENLYNENSAICLAKSANGLHPVFGLWRVDLASDLRDFMQSQKSRKVLAFVEMHHWNTVIFEPSGQMQLDPFFNINTPEDLQIAEDALKEATQ